MVRETYRNYRHQNYLTYIFSSHSFADMARRITVLREMAAVRERKLREIETLSEQVRTEKRKLDTRHKSLDATTKKLARQKVDLERDAQQARAEMKQLSEKEKSALQRKYRDLHINLRMLSGLCRYRGKPDAAVLCRY